MKKTITTAHREPRAKSAREAILDAVEFLYSEHGYNGVTLRHITQAAKTNIASVNYYFGSKENLFAEMIGRRFKPINARRLQLLHTVLREAGDDAPKLEPVLDAFARPFFESAAAPERSEPLRRMIARVLMETDSVAVCVFESELLPVERQFVAAVAQSRPHMSPWQVKLGLHVFSGAMIHLLASLHRLGSCGPDTEETPDNDALFQLLLRCGVAAFDQLNRWSRSDEHCIARYNLAQP